jgi:hypothetical protein
MRSRGRLFDDSKDDGRLSISYVLKQKRKAKNIKN